MTKKQCRYCRNKEIYTAFDFTVNENVILKCDKGVGIIESVTGKDCDGFKPDIPSGYKPVDIW